MECRRWVITSVAALAALAAVGSACSGSGSQPSNSSALPVGTLTATASARGTGTAVGSSAGAGATPIRPSAGVPLIPTSPPIAPVTQATFPTGAVLLQQQGSGTSQQPTVELQTATFVAPGAWDLQWRYDCGALGRSGNLSIDVFRGDGSYINNPPSLAQLGSGGQGVTPYAVAGPLYLVVNSVCAWSVTVTTAARPTATPSGSGSVPAAPPTAAPGSLPAATATPAGATATATASAPGSGLAALTGGRPIIGPAIATPVSPVQQAQGIFALPRSSRAASAATPASSSAPAAVTPAPTPAPIPVVTVAPLGGTPGH
jgi:hypothetical protein